MLDIFEKIFICIVCSIYIVLPILLIIRFGGRQSGLILMATAIFTVNSVVESPIENAVNSIAIRSDLTEIVLTKNLDDKTEEKRLSLISRKNKKKFDLALHRRMEKHFPDWEGRMDFQKKQEKLYKAAMKRQAELRRTRMIDILLYQGRVRRN